MISRTDMHHFYGYCVMKMSSVNLHLTKGIWHITHSMCKHREADSDERGKLDLSKATILRPKKPALGRKYSAGGHGREPDDDDAT